ncbi:657_t:CDS:1 [Acaulospora colombiana]|uniref:657_t:CDS:1 n=1 Tax=Acaulospora colombiana TaxID=27376 RepID=A0ACA9M057_9GLOM|nr:657_t:CDS:1 [Acaulospora colombiana]
MWFESLCDLLYPGMYQSSCSSSRGETQSIFKWDLSVPFLPPMMNAATVARGISTQLVAFTELINTLAATHPSWPHCPHPRYLQSILSFLVVGGVVCASTGSLEQLLV